MVYGKGKKNLNTMCDCVPTGRLMARRNGRYGTSPYLFGSSGARVSTYTRVRVYAPGKKKDDEITT